jgi:outer membrane receptor protein involved in Fe transport
MLLGYNILTNPETLVEEMTMKLKLKRLSGTVKAVLAITVGGSASMLTNAAVLEEVVVTAQKRAQSMQDVPIAISAVKGEDMRVGGIDKMENLAPTVPALHIGEAFGSDQFFLRGLGSGVNFGFEQAVGQVIDGFFYGRSRFGRSQFLDIERVEVLKGPQGALIGKNTTAGAINITTARPTDEFEGWVTANAHVEGNEGWSVEGAVSGGLTDTLMGRFAFLQESRDGYFDNKETGDENQDTDDEVYRASLLYEPSDEFNALFSWTYGDFDRQGRNLDIRKCSASFVSWLGANNVTNEDCRENWKRTADAKRNGIPDESNETEFNTVGLTLNWEFENFTLTSLTGYADYDYFEKGDNDRSPIEYLSSDLGEDYEQFSQEIRLVSSTDGPVEWIVGVFYQETEQDTLFNVNFNGDARGGPAVGHVANRHIFTNQESETYAIFGQLSWHINENWMVTVDGRFTREDKDGEQEQFPTEIYNDNNQIVAPQPGNPIGLYNEHVAKADITEENFSPNVTLVWEPDGDNMYYASIKTGFKGGGFDHQLSADTGALGQAEVDDRFEYDNEEVLSFEVGGKMVLLDGAMHLNWAAFYNKFDDLQVSSLTGTATFTVGNAASAITYGFESDLKWAATDNLTISAAISLLTAEYDDYDGPCHFGQTVAEGCITSGGSTFQELDDETLQFAPDYSFSLSAEYVMPLSDDLELVGFVMVYGQDETELALDLDPNTGQDSYEKWDARLTLRSTDDTWSLSVIGKNLSDERTANFANDHTGFNGGYFSILEPPRTVAIQGTYRF